MFVILADEGRVVVKLHCELFLITKNSRRIIRVNMVLSELSGCHHHLYFDLSCVPASCCRGPSRPKLQTQPLNWRYLHSFFTLCGNLLMKVLALIAIAKWVTAWPSSSTGSCRLSSTAVSSLLLTNSWHLVKKTWYSSGLPEFVSRKSHINSTSSWSITCRILSSTSDSLR